MTANNTSGSTTDLTCGTAVGLKGPYLLEQVLGAGQGPCAGFKIRSAAADRYTVILGTLKPRSVCPIRVVVDPTTLELQKEIKLGSPRTSPTL